MAQRRSNPLGVLMVGMVERISQPMNTGAQRNARRAIEDRVSADRRIEQQLSSFVGRSSGPQDSGQSRTALP